LIPAAARAERRLSIAGTRKYALPGEVVSTSSPARTCVILAAGEARHVGDDPEVGFLLELGDVLQLLVGDGEHELCIAAG